MINLYRIVENSWVDGPGRRVVVYLQGCVLACPGCQSRHLWAARSKNSQEVDEDALAFTVAQMAKDSDGITISGGDPFFQAKSLAFFIRSLRKYGVADIIVFTGYTLEELIYPINPIYVWVREVLPNITTLVDGRFIKELDNPFINFRGSTNQRPINVQETLKQEKLVLWDWDTPEMEITPDGNVVLPIGLAVEFGDFGLAERNRMCGQSKF